MTRLARVAIAAYMMVLTLGLMAGQWFLQGPVLFGVRGHGAHAGDVVVVAATAIAAVALLKPSRHPAGCDGAAGATEASSTRR